MGEFTGILLISDYDGTFTSQVPENYKKNVDAVGEFKKNGGLFAFATGRDYHSLLAIEPDFENIANAPVIIANGARLYDINAKNYIISHTLDLVLFSNFLEILYKRYPETGIRFSCDGGLVTPCLNELLIEDLNDIFMRDARVREMPFEQLRASGEGVYKCVMVNEPGTVDALKALAAEFCGSNPDAGCGIYFTKSYARGLEAVNKSASKGATALKLKEYLNARDKIKYKLCAIGDYDNDLDMIALADHGAAPANALDEVKKAAKTITAAASDGAVADFIEIIKTIGRVAL